jgi:hypothetical protein
MRIRSAITTEATTTVACDLLLSQIADESAPSLVVVSASSDHDIGTIAKTLTSELGCQVHGMTSCRGIMTDAGHTVAGGTGLGLLAITDPTGDYGTACAGFDGDPRDASRRVLQAALQKADRVGESPDLVWLSTSPGSEEAVLAGIRDCIGPDVPVVGGSAADNTVSGGWQVFDGSRVTGEGLVATAMFSSGMVSDVFQSGYSPTGGAGVLTRTEGRRIHEIDGKPAYAVYRGWTSGALPAQPDRTHSILAESTFWPLGRTVARGDGFGDIVLLHPAAVHPDGSMDVFATPTEGETVRQMSGTADALINRSGQVVALSRSALDRKGAAASGALVVFCGGCMLAVQDRVDEVVDRVRESMGPLPFLGVFTFGEQGRIPTGGNIHGNLMISSVAFGSC